MNSFNIQLVLTAITTRLKLMMRRRMMRNSGTFQTSSVISPHVHLDIPASLHPLCHHQFLPQALRLLSHPTMERKPLITKTRVKKYALHAVIRARIVLLLLSEEALRDGVHLSRSRIPRIYQGNEVIAALTNVNPGVQEAQRASKYLRSTYLGFQLKLAVEKI